MPPTTTPVTWVKNNLNGQWFDFLNLDLSAPYFVNRQGVYAIWYTHPSAAKVIRIGSGLIATRLSEHRSNPEILKYSQYGQLKVSWIDMGTQPNVVQMQG